jgi:hypothetical protein
LLGTDNPGSSHSVQATDAFIGRVYENEYFNGEIEELAIWKRDLSSEEILMLYNYSTCDVESDPHICISACDGSLYIPDHSVWDSEYLPLLHKFYTLEIRVRQMQWDPVLQMCYNHIVWPVTAFNYALEILPNAEYVLNVPLTNAIKGIYTIEAWVKYTHDYNGADKYAINTEWWGVAAVGVIGTTKLGWPQSPDRWEKVSVTFDTGQHAPLNMKWFVGKRDNGGNIGYIYVTDLSIDGPQGTTYLFGNFANGADLSYYDASSSSATSTYSIVSYLNSNQLP